MKCVLIIGGNCDIGIALTNYFLNNNYNVVIGYHNNDTKYNQNVEYIKCDVTNNSDIENIISKTKETYGNIDIIINLACLCMDNNFLDKTKEEFMKVLEVNLVGTFLCNQIYSKYIDNGLIINMSSTDGIDTYSKYSIDYSASKAGIISISKSISLCTNNKVLCICPNWIDTSSTKDMDKDYLNSELIRINQSRLISIEEFISGFDKIINDKFNSGDTYRIDIKGDKLWVEKM
jgi:NAD(P)-dependent dehydrogenase (short-subunit alcohol dehydrogenase family)